MQYKAFYLKLTAIKKYLKSKTMSQIIYFYNRMSF